MAFGDNCGKEYRRMPLSYSCCQDHNFRFKKPLHSRAPLANNNMSQSSSCSSKAKANNFNQIDDLRGQGNAITSVFIGESKTAKVIPLLQNQSFFNNSALPAPLATFVLSGVFCEKRVFFEHVCNKAAPRAPQGKSFPAVSFF